MKKKITCRVMPEWKNPKCDWCYDKGRCQGPVDRTPGAYSAGNCPGQKGQECLYCRDVKFCIRKDQI